MPDLSEPLLFNALAAVRANRKVPLSLLSKEWVFQSLVTESSNIFKALSEALPKFAIKCNLQPNLPISEI